MSSFEILMPKLGESVQEATITKMFVNLNDVIEEDDMLFEIATDKVDSEIPSPVSGKVIEIRFKEDDVVPVGEVVAIINMSEDAADAESVSQIKEEVAVEVVEEKVVNEASEIKSDSDRFYSPLVKAIAQKENILQAELDAIVGHGKDGRVQKEDVLKFVAERGASSQVQSASVSATKVEKALTSTQKPKVSMSVGANDQIIEMDRMRRIIADHMVMSKQTSPHVTAMVEADVTDMVNWRNKVKDEFFAKEKTKITFMPIIIEAVSKALREFPMINSSVDDYKIIVKKDINIGVAVALPSGNLIVPVIKNADQKNLLGLTVGMNILADKARNNKLDADDIQGGTFTISNFGSFKNVMGTPIINQPQVAILAVGTIEKKPAVLETPDGDVIVPRQKMFLSLSYDHRVVDGALGGAFLRKIADYLEEFDLNRAF
ncbi:2-oxo acid dehydrogenase subunit E2 [Ancylomarina euxinus]|uniref:Dihydrolipoamide acetyltransferase component of pyruvate dehydrogenase complex n=1 Tax=Ancylomarina euxinus TaxID=2283627 RepID=A0A425Y0G8_9BACT|nr:dihydrolipoamide acetyltransferase family protein [Ancylomarina euxinus]MCZ4695322.1 dihydrolipoamide acetyltransferase family protein [Ancylomarina euxinus]MUP15517.1 2-oxo acid dehydrogenase subunit E2 [Ancylomarina euxinus]RRG21223.1 2-oxo acid dehydrogenase subunit E2 [Ancylomarina euxinus]